MPSSWPQPAVLTNLLTSSSITHKDDDGKESNKYRVLALYKFVSPIIPMSSLPDLKSELDRLCRQHSARGTILLAEEGINGTICYPFKNKSKSKTIIVDSDKDDDKTATTTITKKDNDAKNVNYDGSDYDDEKKEHYSEQSTDIVDDNDELLSFLQNKFDHSLRIRISVVDQSIFSRLKIRIKSEIVTMKKEGNKCRNSNNDTDGNDAGSDYTTIATTAHTCGPCCPTKEVGEYVSPREWNKLLLDPETVVVDTRNEYEIDVGTFQNSINPHTQSFVEFPDWIRANIIGNGEDDGKKKIAMFCTGGIRCEKATNVCLQLIPKTKNVSVYHLEGGILAYLDEFAEKRDESLFKGDCYVFDQRVAVTYGNKPSTIFREKCHACRHPLSCDDLKRDDYVQGLSCKYCFDQLSKKQQERFTQRQKQMELALKSGKQHIHDSKEQNIDHNKKTCIRR